MSWLSWFRASYSDRKVLAELRLVRIALQRIADSMEQPEERSGTSLRSWYQSDEPAEAAMVLLQTDDDMARLEAIERRAAETGYAVPLDADLEEDERSRS